MEEQFFRGKVLVADAHTFSETHVSGGGMTFRGTGGSSVSSSTTHWVKMLIRLQSEHGAEEHVLTVPPEKMIGIHPGDDIALAFAEGGYTYVANITTQKFVTLSDPFRSGCASTIVMGIALGFGVYWLSELLENQRFGLLFSLLLWILAAIAVIVIYARERKKQVDAYTNHQRLFYEYIGWHDQAPANPSGTKPSA